MCRFLVYRGNDEILLSKLILDPTHSILKQSFDSRLRLDTRRGQNNADGFGIGFYTDPKLGAAPCLFTSTIPAWNCTNLSRLASKTASHLVFAHVRATTEGSLSEDNCHPFTHGSLMWMHNGGLGGWKYIKRRLGALLHDKWYLNVQGGTDSEWAFALFLDRLERLGANPSEQKDGGFGPGVLRKAMLMTIEAINELTDQIPESVVQAENVDTRSLLNFAVTDGESIICTRYVSSSTDEAASLYYSSGSQWATKPSSTTDRDYHMERNDKGGDIVLVASEPLTFERETWIGVPSNSILTIHKESVSVRSINDRYTNRHPFSKRSSAFAQTKGLTTNEKAPPPPVTISQPGTPSPEMDGQKRFPSPLIPLTVSRSRTPETASLPIPRRPAQLSAEAAGTTKGQVTSDIRTVTSLATSPQKAPFTPRQPSQGNIKKKRRSLTLNEVPHPAESVDSEVQAPESPVANHVRASEYGNSEKAARILGLSI